jgi:hypothetical protein
MSERDKILDIIEQYTELEKKDDNYDRHFYYIKLKNRKGSAIIIKELSHTGNGYINGRYVNTSSYKTTKAGDISIKNLSAFEIIKLIDEAIHNIR